MRFAVLFALSCAAAAAAHDIITTPITWSREISAIFQKKCVSCHGTGNAFALTTYAETRPWAVAIREEVLARTMPPWGAVKGFGEFANDMSLSPEEIELIVKWTDGGTPEGDPKAAPEWKEPAALSLPEKGRVTVEGTFKLPKAFRLGALLPVKASAEFQMTAELPDGSIVPLLWLKDYNPRFAHPFVLREELRLPKGTVIRGVPKGASVTLVPTSP